MGPFFTRERFGRPQFLAAALLMAFLAQGLWLAYAELSAAESFESDEAIRIAEGLKQWHGHGIAGAPMTGTANQPVVHVFRTDESGFDTQHSPLLSLVSSATLLVWPHNLNADAARYWRWLPRIPFLACGVFLGASLWYVARRLCGNTGGFVALTLYCFSPSLIQTSAIWHTEPGILAAWGAFGTVFTAIAVAHTLYAPREVVLWNWRRIVLLGVALAIAIGSQFTFVILVPMALAFLLYLAPVRRLAGFVIWLTACGIGFLLFFAAYFFHFHAFTGALRHAVFWGYSAQGFALAGVYKQIMVQIWRACPAMTLILPVTLITYCVWRRTRYFGNTAPLIVGALFVALAIARAQPGGGFLLAAMPFLFVFVSGVLADLLETKSGPGVRAVLATWLIICVARTLVAIAQVPRG